MLLKIKVYIRAGPHKEESAPCCGILYAILPHAHHAKGGCVVAIVSQCSACHNYILNLPAEFQAALAVLAEEQQAAVLNGLCANCRDSDEYFALSSRESEPRKLFLQALHLR